MTKNIKLLLSASTVACFAISLLQGCGSDATNGGTPTAGAPGAGAANKAGASGVGAPGAGAPGAGAPGAGATSAGAPGAGAPGAGAPGAGAGGASGGTGGASGGAGGAKGGAGGASGSAGAGGAKGGAGGGGGASGAAGAGGGSAGAGGGAALTCLTNTPYAGMGETCATYCANYETTCQANVAGGWTNTKYATKAACLTDCNNSFGYTGADIQSAICCRAYHVKNAAMGGTDANKNTHCPHAAGAALCK